MAANNAEPRKEGDPEKEGRWSIYWLELTPPHLIYLMGGG
jgi:hypothetical protein